MDNERTRVQENSSGKLRGHEPRRAANGFLLLDALLMLSAVATAIAIGMPQALPVAPDHDYAAVAVSTDSDLTGQEEVLEAVEEQHEPLITDDLRAHGSKYAWVDLPAAIG
jgi:hypothetical protein